MNLYRLQAVPFWSVERSREKNWGEQAEGGLGRGVIAFRVLCNHRNFQMVTEVRVNKSTVYILHLK